MKLTLHEDASSYTITAYDSGEFTVRGQRLVGSQLVYASQPPSSWPATGVHQLDPTALDSMLLDDIEMVILGTGTVLVFPDDQWLMLFAERGIGIEVMDTAAACRTFNILVSEGRRVMAALIPVE